MENEGCQNEFVILDDEKIEDLFCRAGALQSQEEHPTFPFGCYEFTGNPLGSWSLPTRNGWFTCHLKVGVVGPSSDKKI